LVSPFSYVHGYSNCGWFWENTYKIETSFDGWTHGLHLEGGDCFFLPAVANIYIYSISAIHQLLIYVCIICTSTLYQLYIYINHKWLPKSQGLQTCHKNKSLFQNIWTLYQLHI
jgi:hypothetical protein